MVSKKSNEEKVAGAPLTTEKMERNQCVRTRLHQTNSFRQTSRNPESRKIVGQKKRTTSSKVNGMMMARNEDEYPHLSRQNQLCGVKIDKIIRLSSSLQEFLRKLIVRWGKGKSKAHDHFADPLFMSMSQISYFSGKIEWNYVNELSVIRIMDKGRTGGYKNGS